MFHQRETAISCIAMRLSDSIHEHILLSVSCLNTSNGDEKRSGSSLVLALTQPCTLHCMQYSHGRLKPPAHPAKHHSLIDARRPRQAEIRLFRMSIAPHDRHPPDVHRIAARNIMQPASRLLALRLSNASYAHEGTTSAVEYGAHSDPMPVPTMYAVAEMPSADSWRGESG